MTTEERAKEALDHLQRAALEMIAAARAVLDVAEELVQDPTPLAAFAAGMSQAVVQAAAQAGAHGPAGASEPAGPRVQHIRVS
jgi:hypothetical protein